MSFAFTTRLPLSRHEIDRDHLRRSGPALFEDLSADPRTRVLPVWRGKAIVNRSPGHLSLMLFPVEAVDTKPLAVYLGRSLAKDAHEPVGTPIVAVPLTDAAAAELEPDESRWLGLRDLAMVASDRDTGILTEAAAILNWHATFTHCTRCGEATVVEDGGWTRRCPADGTQIFPRTDPAVIVLITDADDRILLGSNALWENNRYSLLAGFVEPGESLESAVIREVHEESGLRVTDPEYLGSQPWPFPASLMCGFTARLADDEHPTAIEPDGEEILDLRWFSREELLASTDTVKLPGKSSIARAMIENWLGHALEPENGAETRHA